MSRGATRAWRWMGAAGLVAALLAGCGRRSADLLVVYSGDCQGYIEPCG